MNPQHLVNDNWLMRSYRHAGRSVFEFAKSQENIDKVAKWGGGGVALCAFIMSAVVVGYLIVR